MVSGCIIIELWYSSTVLYAERLTNIQIQYHRILSMSECGDRVFSLDMKRERIHTVLYGSA